MTYIHEIANAFDDAIGTDGASKTRFNELLRQTEGALGTLASHKKNNSLPVLNLAEREDDLALIEKTAREIAAFKTFVVVGMGGSSYGGMALCALAQNPFRHAGGTHVHFVDNIDPLTADRSLLCLDFKTTIFALVSKSGDTAETLAQALILINEAQARLGKDKVRDHFIAITEPKDSALTRLAGQYGMQVLEHDNAIGGRFSVLTNVGLLPAAVAGVDIRAVRKGAAGVVKDAFSRTDSEPARGAALAVTLMEQGRRLSVLMPYCDRLNNFNVWYCQLWGESLGKGGHGSTPLRSLGACDQHSQLQLYLDGPKDKLISLILLEQAGKGSSLPDITDASLKYLKGRTLGDLMDAEQRATAATLTKNKCPLRIFHLKQLDEETMGALLMHFMLETMIAGELLGINTFDQPAVEEGKNLAREYLARG